MKLAVVGGGWAGLAAAVRAVQAGHRVTVFEMAAQAGGRARTVAAGDVALDNGQHILIGAYRRTLALMADVGVDVAAVFDRRPLELRFADGRGLRLPPGGPAALAFVRGVLTAVGWTARDRMALLVATAGWAGRGFRCDERLTVAELCVGLPPAVRSLLIDPLCIAALNTPARDASAAVLLRVLRDALFGGRGGADLLLPRAALSELLPAPAERWLRTAGAGWCTGCRVEALERQAGGWRVTAAPPAGAADAFDAVVLACTAAEAARLAAPHAPGWSASARALRHEPIVTVYLHCPGAHLPAPMTALEDGPQAPAQFAFDHGALGGAADRFAFVASGAAAWADAGLEATAQAVLQQATEALQPWPRRPDVLRVLADKRATFRCTPALRRPPAAVAPGLVAAGDYVAGPYPATLEGAVRSGEAAVAALTAPRS